MTTTTETSAAVTYEVIREESLESVRDALIALYEATRSHRTDAARFNWLYRDNPDGPAVIWSLRRGEAGERIGFTACLPRRMRVNGQSRLAWIGSDFSVLPRYRTLGLAAKLRRAAKEAIDAGAADFLYAHPNDRMAPIHHRVGHAPIGLMQRYARPFSVGPIIEERWGSRLLGRVGRFAGDPLLRLFDARHHRGGRYVIRQQDATGFDDAFDQLFQQHAPSSGVIGVRDARYLQWRYGDNPVYRSRLLTAYDGDRLAGYLVFTIDENAALIKDIFPSTDPAVVGDLLAGLNNIGHESNLRGATYTLFEQNPALPTMRTFGYRPRLEQSQMFAYAAADADWRTTLHDKTQWCITVGDRDV